MEEFQDIFVFSITAKDVMANILIALFCGLFIALLYKYTYRGLNYSVAFTVSLIMLTMITAVVIMVIGNNLARAFGMVGAMSIIRFRTAVKDASDIMFIFFALTIGLASGVKLYSIAIFGTAFIGLTYFVISKFNFALPKSREFLLQVLSVPDRMEDNPMNHLLEKYCKSHKLVNLKTLGEDGSETLEMSYYINLSDTQKGVKLVGEIKNLQGIKQAQLFFDETQ